MRIKHLPGALSKFFRVLALNDAWRFYFNRRGLIPRSLLRPKSVIPACFKRESSEIRTGPPIKTFGGDASKTNLLGEFRYLAACCEVVHFCGTSASLSAFLFHLTWLYYFLAAELVNLSMRPICAAMIVRYVD